LFLNLYEKRVDLFIDKRSVCQFLKMTSFDVERECEKLAAELVQKVLEGALQDAQDVTTKSPALINGNLNHLTASNDQRLAAETKTTASLVDSNIELEEVAVEYQRTPSPERKNPIEYVYYTKQIIFQDKSINILLQNENGPCPLIAIINALVLRSDIQIHKPIMDSSGLLELLANFIMERPAKSAQDEYARHESIELLPDLLFGMDINPYFERHDQFEYTKQLSIFDFLAIPIVHGWVWNPKEFVGPDETWNLKSYNHLVEYLIDQPNGNQYLI
jgi:hypothetical protein